MRLAVLSDIHGNLTALEAALADLNAVGTVDHVWVLGDLAAFGPRPAECVRRVQALKETYGEEKIAFIRGNTDRYLVKGERPAWDTPVEDEATFQQILAEYTTRDTVFNWALAQLSFEDYTFLTKLHDETSLEAPGYGWVIGYHGTPGDDEGFLRPDTPDEEARDLLMDREGRMGIGGHIHVQMDRDLRSWRAINVGSVGMSFDRPGVAEWGLFTFENGDVHVDLHGVPYDVDALRADFRASAHPAVDWTLTKFRMD
jgi:predicted phosphodiesterase